MNTVRSIVFAVLAAVLGSTTTSPGCADELPTAPAEAVDATGEGISFGQVEVSVFGELTFRSTDFGTATGSGSGVQGYTNLRLSAWPWARGSKRLKLYADLVPATGTQQEYSWQRYGQIDLGVQWLPLLDREGVPAPAQGLRLFVQATTRGYYGQPDGTDRPSFDLWLGADFYYDDLLSRRRWGISAFTSAAFRRTNFTTGDYHAPMWEGSVDAGPKRELANGLWIPYAVAEWAYSPQHPELWWENHLRLGLGLRWFPAGCSSQGAAGWARQLRERLQLFTEVVHRVAWTGDRPQIEVENTDVRFGLAYATGGVRRHRLRGGAR